MFFFNEPSERSESELRNILFYQGGGEIGAISEGLYDETNADERVDVSAWMNDPDLSLIFLRQMNAVNEQYYIYNCAMFRKLADESSVLQMKVDDSI